MWDWCLFWKRNVQLLKVIFCFDFSGGLFGENFIARHILPLPKNVVRYCIDVSSMNKPEPMQSWSALALIDCLMAFEGLVTVLPKEAVVKELTEVSI